MASFSKFLLIGILTIIIIIFSLNPQFTPILSDLTLKKVLAALGGLFVIVLLVERATEIVISIWRHEPTEQLKVKIFALKRDPKSAATVMDEEKKLTKYQAETKGNALLISFTLSIIVCSAGVGLLGEIIDTTKGNMQFIRGVDIVLTAGLISGGSDSFHQFVRAIETFFNESKKKMEKSQQ